MSGPLAVILGVSVAAPNLTSLSYTILLLSSHDGDI